MKSKIIYTLSSLPLWGTPLFVWLLTRLAGPTYTNAPEQGAMLILFVGTLLWILIATVSVIIAIILAAKPRKTIVIYSLVSWVIGIAGLIYLMGRVGA